MSEFRLHKQTDNHKASKHNNTMKFCRINAQQSLPIDHLPSIASEMLLESRDVGPPRIHVIWPEGPATWPPPSTASSDTAGKMKITSRLAEQLGSVTLVATTTLSRGTWPARSQRPRSSSLRPCVSLRCGTGYLTRAHVHPGPSVTFYFKHVR